jgi:hypothetical protein
MIKKFAADKKGGETNFLEILIRLEKDMKEMKEDMKEMKKDMTKMKDDILKTVREDMTKMKEEIVEIRTGLTSVFNRNVYHSRSDSFVFF